MAKEQIPLLVLTLSQAATALGLTDEHLSHVLENASSGLHAVAIPIGEEWLFPVSDLRSWLDGKESWNAIVKAAAGNDART